MVLTDAQFKVLLVDYRNAKTAADNGAAQLAAAAKALAQGLGPGGEIIVQGYRVRTNAAGDGVIVENVRVVA
jgi:hypothetical protein